MEFRTSLKNREKYRFIEYSDKILILGSCFAENVAHYLHGLKYQVLQNPCGISYNPASIAKSLEYLGGKKLINEKEIHSNNGVYFHFDFHGSFNRLDKAETWKHIQKSLDLGKEFRKADVVILTLGTAFVYRLIEEDIWVNNCHKLPNNLFRKEFLDPKKVYKILEKAILNFRSGNEKTKVILSVSPIRHLKDGMIENNYSKSSLLLACKWLIEDLEEIYYMPSYELLMDDLRDYRFYKKDLIHPTDTAKDYIMDFFEDHFLNPTELEKRKQIKKISLQLKHKSIFPGSEAHQKFIDNLINEIKKTEKKYGLDYSTEIQKLKSK